MSGGKTASPLCAMAVYLYSCHVLTGQNASVFNLLQISQTGKSCPCVCIYEIFKKENNVKVTLYQYRATFSYLLQVQGAELIHVNFNVFPLYCI